MEKTYNFSPLFKDRWNYLATEGEIYPDGIAELKAISETTPGKDDDDFLAAIEAVTVEEYDDYFDSSAILCREAEAAERAGLTVNGLSIYFAYAADERRIVKIRGYKPECSTSVQSYKRTGPSPWETYHMRSDPFLGYQYLRWDDADKFDGDSHGLHLAANYAPWSSRYFYPAVEAQLNMVFDDFGIQGGAGIGVYAGYDKVWRDFGVMMYAKMMVNGHGAKMDGWKDGWSADAVFGLKIFFVYAEGTVPAAGSEFMPSRGFSGISVGLTGNIGPTPHYPEKQKAGKETIAEDDGVLQVEHYDDGGAAATFISNGFLDRLSESPSDEPTAD